MAKVGAWYDKDLSGDERADKILSSVRHALNRDAARLDRYRLVTELHDARGNHAAFCDLSLHPQSSQRNVLRRACDTVHARLVSSTPRPFYCSDGGDADLRWRLERLNSAVHGLFLSTRADDHASLATRHAVVYGDGFLKVHAVASPPRVTVEVVYPWEVFHEELEELYGAPAVTYQVRWLERDQAERLWPEAKKKDSARQVSSHALDVPLWSRASTSASDPVAVVEAWRTGPGGRHALVVDGRLVVDEPYDLPHTSLVHFQYQRPLIGYWSDGVGFQLATLQREINDLSDAISETIRLGAFPAVLVEKNSEVVAEHLTNIPLRVIKYRGQPPQIQPSPPLATEARAYLDALASTAYEAVGLSQYAVSGTKPVGLTSGRALRAYADREEGNLREPGDLREAAYLALGEALVAAQREVSRVNPGATVLFTDASKRTTTRIRWADVDVDSNDLRLVGQPISLLPSTPAARVALLDELASAGILTPQEIRDHLDLPDLRASNETANAPRRVVEQQLLEIERDGKPHLPEPFFPHEEALQLAVQRYCAALMARVPEDRLELLRRYVVACVDFLNPPTPQPEGQEIFDDGVVGQPDAGTSGEPDASAAPDPGAAPGGDLPLEGEPPGEPEPGAAGDAGETG
jgi:hypothetical protein